MVQVWNFYFGYKIVFFTCIFYRKYKIYEKKILCGIKLVWSNGSTDVVGDTKDDNTWTQYRDMEMFTMSLTEGEHIQTLDLCTATDGIIEAGLRWQNGFIEKVKLTTNKGKVFEPLGSEGRAAMNANSFIRRRGVNPKHMYLDGIRGDVVVMLTHGAVAINRISFKWSFVMDKVELPQNYFNPLPPVHSGSKSEKISVLDLEKDINLREEAAEFEWLRDWPRNRDNEMVVWGPGLNGGAWIYPIRGDYWTSGGEWR